MVDPRDPRYQALIAESRQADFDNLLRYHQAQEIQRRRDMGRGLTTFSAGVPNPDRRDEAYQRTFQSLDYPRVAGDRRAQARAVLEAAGRTSGIGMSGGSALAAGNLANAQRNVQAGGINLIGAGLEAADRNLPPLESLFPSAQPPADPRVGSRPGAGFNNPHTG
jgi:hypothetical protein